MKKIIHLEMRKDVTPHHIPRICRVRLRVRFKGSLLTRALRHAQFCAYFRERVWAYGPEYTLKVWPYEVGR